MVNLCIHNLNIFCISCFRQISNTQWKKYVDGSKQSAIDNSLRELQKSANTSRSNSPSMFDKKRIEVTSATNSQRNSPDPSNAKKYDKKQTVSDKNESYKSAKDKSLDPSLNKGQKSTKTVNNHKSSVSSGSEESKKHGNISNGSNSANVKGKGIQRSDKDYMSHRIQSDMQDQMLEKPRTKLKVSGGTQTTSDLDFMPSGGAHSDGEISFNNTLEKEYQKKSYSLNGPAANQMSQHIRQQILQATYAKISPLSDYNIYASPLDYQDKAGRFNYTEDFRSDSPYSNYVEIQYSDSPYSSPYSWLPRHEYSDVSASPPTR